MADVVGIWISAILTIAITTLAWKDQPVSKFAERIYVGVVTANFLVMAWRNISTIGISKIVTGSTIFILAIVLGLMTYARYSQKYFWLYRYPIALVIGIGVGVSMRGMVGAEFIDQIKDSLFILAVPGDIMSSFTNIIFFLILLTSMTYFIFTIKATRSPIIMKISLIGRYAMMGAFGYSFANTIATRIEQYAGRISFLLLEWLRIQG